MSTMSVVDNRELVKQAGFPVGMLPSVTVVSQLIHFLLAIPILAGFLMYDGYQASISLAALPAIIVVQFLLTLSLAYFVATLQVKFRDVQYLVGIALFLSFYLTPIFWSDSAVPEPYGSMMRLNPVAVILKAYRAILIRREWPEPVPLAMVAGGAAVLLALGYSLFSLARNRFVEEL
jgi:lipopolysaccharide transport system permease protein